MLFSVSETITYKKEGECKAIRKSENDDTDDVQTHTNAFRKKPQRAIYG